MIDGTLDNRRTKVIEFANKLGKREKLLDIGCAGGDISILLKEALKVKEVYGVEITEEGVKQAKRKGVKAIKLDLDEVEKLPFEDNYFDIIFCGEIIEHLFDPDHLLEEIYRLLNTDGFGIITTPNLAAWFERLSLLLGFQPFSTAIRLKYCLFGKLITQEKTEAVLEPSLGHIRVMTFKTFKQILVEHNFKIKCVVGTYGSAFYLPKAIRPMYKLISRVLSTPSLSPNITAIIAKR